MVFKWREEHTPLFLDLFRSYECLWDHKNKDYKNRAVRERAVTAFKNALNLDGVTEEDIRLKIKTIRTRYSAELTKIIRSQRNGEELYVPKLYWFRHADFLRNVCQPRASELFYDTSSYEAEHTTEDQSALEWCEVESSKVKQEDHSHLAEYQTTDNHGETIEIRRAPIAFPTKKIYVKPSEITSLAKAVKELKNLQKEVASKHENEFDLFCRSLAVQLNNMPIHQALACQQKLQNVMTQFRMSHLCEELQEEEVEAVESSNSQQTHYVIDSNVTTEIIDEHFETI